MPPDDANLPDDANPPDDPTRWLYILDGQTPTPEWDGKAWYEWIENNDREIARTDFFTATVVRRVSTYFVPFPLPPEKPGQPLRFFATARLAGPTTEKLAGYAPRQIYATWAEAQRGHDEIVATLKARSIGRTGLS